MDNALALELLQSAVIVRTGDSLDEMSATLRAAVQEVLPALPVSSVRAVD